MLKSLYFKLRHFDGEVFKLVRCTYNEVSLSRISNNQVTRVKLICILPSVLPGCNVEFGVNEILFARPVINHVFILYANSGARTTFKTKFSFLLI